VALGIVEPKPAPSLARAASVAAPAPEIEPSSLPPPPAETEEQRIDRIKRFGDLPYDVIAHNPLHLHPLLALQEKWLGEIGRSNNAPVNWEAFDLFKQERRADLAAAGLTPDEITECELHVFGDTLLNTFSHLGFELTPAEQRAIYRSLDWGGPELHRRGLSQGEEIAIRERIGLMKYEQIYAIIGPERAMVWNNSDLRYRRFSALAEDLGKPATLADQLWRIRSESLIRTGELLSLSSDRANYDQQLSVLHAEIRVRVVSLIGEAAIDKNPATFESWMGSATLATRASPPSP
jgi:hypothetical protein